MPDKLTIKQVRRLNDLTLDEVAKRLDVSTQTWSRYENKDTAIPAVKFIYFCEWLNVDPKNVKL